MNEQKFDRWIKNIQATEEDEISCTDCFDLVSDYVDAELAGSEIRGVLSRVKQHLGQCKACQDEYELLRDLVGMENNNQERNPEDDLKPR